MGLLQQSTTNTYQQTARTPGSLWFIILGKSWRRRRRCRDRKQKHGCRASSWERLRKTPHKPLLPSLFLTNARSAVNKMDELRLQLLDNKLLLPSITESLLYPAIPAAAVEPEGRVLHHYDKNLNSEKQQGGGLGIFISEQWAENTKTIASSCTRKPFFLHQELSSVVLITIEYHNVDLKAVVPKFHLHCDCLNHVQLCCYGNTSHMRFGIMGTVELLASNHDRAPPQGSVSRHTQNPGRPSWI